MSTYSLSSPLLTERGSVLGDEPEVVAPERHHADGKHGGGEEEKQYVQVVQVGVGQTLQDNKTHSGLTQYGHTTPARPAFKKRVSGVAAG